MRRIDLDRLGLLLNQHRGLASRLASRTGYSRSTISRAANRKSVMRLEYELRLVDALIAEGVEPPWVPDATGTRPGRDAISPFISALDQLQLLDSAPPYRALPALTELEDNVAAVSESAAARIAQSRPWKYSTLADHDSVVTETDRIRGRYASAMTPETATELDRMEAVARSARGDHLRAEEMLLRLADERDGRWPRYSPPPEHFLAKNSGRLAMALVSADRRMALEAYRKALAWFDSADLGRGDDPVDPRFSWNDLQRANLIVAMGDLLGTRADERRVETLLKSSKLLLARDGVGVGLHQIALVGVMWRKGEPPSRIQRELRPAIRELIRHQHISGVAHGLRLIAITAGIERSYFDSLAAATAAYCLLPFEWFYRQVYEPVSYARKARPDKFNVWIETQKRHALQGMGEFRILDLLLDRSGPEMEAVIAKVFDDVGQVRVPIKVRVVREVGFGPEKR